MSWKKIIIVFISLALISPLIFLSAPWFKSLDPSVSASLITAFIGMLGLWYAQWQSKSRDIAESHRASKVEVYNLLFSIVEKIQAEENFDFENKSNQKWMKENFTKLNRGLVLWASPNVIKSWLLFRTASDSGGNMLMIVDALYKSIRSDLGNSNANLKNGDLIRIGLSDPAELKS